MTKFILITIFALSTTITLLAMLAVSIGADYNDQSGRAIIAMMSGAGGYAVISVLLEFVERRKQSKA